MICRSTAWKPVSLTCWINKNLFSSNKIWWGDNFASIQHKGLSHVQGCCTLRANQLKIWRGGSAHGGQDDRGRYGWSGPPLGTGLHVPTKQSKVLFVPLKIIQWIFFFNSKPLVSTLWGSQYPTGLPEGTNFMTALMDNPPNYLITHPVGLSKITLKRIPTTLDSSFNIFWHEQLSIKAKTHRNKPLIWDFIRR